MSKEHTGINWTQLEAEISVLEKLIAEKREAAELREREMRTPSNGDYIERVDIIMRNIKEQRDYMAAWAEAERFSGALGAQINAVLSLDAALVKLNKVKNHYVRDIRDIL